MSLTSMGGAVDLSMFKKPDQPAEEPTAIPGPWVYELTGEGLQGALLMSNKVPVIVAFHSSRSDNSAALLADLERLVTAKAGRLQLAKVNVDEQAEVAQAFGISAVPAAAALLQAQPVPLFQGVPQADQLSDTVDKIVEAAAQYGITGVLDNDAEAAAAVPEVPPLHKEGLAAMENGDLGGAHAAYAKALAENPGDHEAQTALYQVELLERIAKINPEGDVAKVEEVLMKAAQAPVTDIEVHLQAADIEFSFQRPDAAFGRLIEVVRGTSGEDRDAVRERLIAYFDMLGPGELVTQARKALTNALF
ncbi:co-chaperone YbbN [Trueperella pecoris]|uniref:co-chaperone YbbN n=1 Tax=Trueperella pecoris TaxID=2733571 RepID=UPI00186BAFDA|nr:tetratricopeptide repeat protein [Trueperella pecoris]QOQ39230.1 tetratricopeptide repeat protein [Trueperella pecoris]